MKVSLVTTVLDEADWAPDLIRSILRQSRPPDEWLVVDGGSSDGTVGVFAAEPSCTLIEAPGNIARGRNAGIARAQGDVIAVIDGGCVAEPRWLERLLVPLEAGAADIAIGATAPRIEGAFHAVQWVLLDQLRAPGLRLGDPAASSRSLAFLRPAWERCPYPEWLDHSEDVWLLRQWRRLGLRFVRVPEAVVVWRLRATVGEWMGQHFRYMRGQGRAGLHGSRHGARMLFYAALFALLLGGTSRPGLAAAAVAVWAAYAAANLVRLPGATVGSGWRSTFATLGWLPGMLLAMDGAKVAGYLEGLLERVAARA